MSSSSPVDTTEITEDDTGLVTASSVPVDMDQYCEDGSSTASVPPVVEASDTSANLTPSSQGSPKAATSRTSALTKAMALRQASITQSFTSLIEKQLQTAEEGGTMSQAKIDVLRIKMEGAVRKQKNMTQQFDALVQRLEQEAQEKEQSNKQLKRNLHLAHKLMKSEGLMTDSQIADALRSTTKSPRHKTLPRGHGGAKEREIFSITEIFCTSSPKEPEMDEMTCHFQYDSSSKNAASPPRTKRSSRGSKKKHVDGDGMLASELELLEV